MKRHPILSALVMLVCLSLPAVSMGEVFGCPQLGETLLTRHSKTSSEYSGKISKTEAEGLPHMLRNTTLVSVEYMGAVPTADTISVTPEFKKTMWAHQDEDDKQHYACMYTDSGSGLVLMLQLSDQNLPGGGQLSLPVERAGNFWKFKKTEDGVGMYIMCEQSREDCLFRVGMLGVLFNSQVANLDPENQEAAIEFTGVAYDFEGHPYQPLKVLVNGVAAFRSTSQRPIVVGEVQASFTYKGISSSIFEVTDKPDACRMSTIPHVMECPCTSEGLAESFRSGHTLLKITAKPTEGKTELQCAVYNIGNFSNPDDKSRQPGGEGSPDIIIYEKSRQLGNASKEEL